MDFGIACGTAVYRSNNIIHQSNHGSRSSRDTRSYVPLSDELLYPSNQVSKTVLRYLRCKRPCCPFPQLDHQSRTNVHSKSWRSTIGTYIIRHRSSTCSQCGCSNTEHLCRWELSRCYHRLLNKYSIVSLVVEKIRSTYRVY